MTKKELREELINTIWDIMYNKKKYVISRHDPVLDAIADYILSTPCLELLKGEFEVQKKIENCKAPNCQCEGDAINDNTINFYIII